MITENLSTLKINKLTQAQYDRELEAGNIDPTALYLTPDELDITLTQSGKAADAKAVGDKLNKLEYEISELNDVYVGTDEPTDPNVQIWINPDEDVSDINYVKSVNGITPDENGNVKITIPDSGQNANHPLARKRLSIIGDSISTFSGYIPNGYEAWYPKNYVDTVEKTWWYQLIQKTGMVLCKNASWSGSTLCGDSKSTSGIVGCSDARVEAVSGEDEPDIIIVFIGINDFAKSNGYSCGEYDGSSSVTANATVTNITDAYGLLLSKLRQRYPNAFVCGCRIMPEQYSGGSMNASFSGGFPNVNPDDSVSLPALNEQIEKICRAFGCGVIPMDASGISFYNATDCTGDGLHPNEEQMARIALVAERWLGAYSAEIGTGNAGDTSDDENGGDVDTRKMLYNWDFTKSLTDTISGITATAEVTEKSDGYGVSPVQDSSGVHFVGKGQALNFGNIFALNRTYEIDIASLEYKGSATYNMRLFTLWQGAGSDSVSGFLYRHTANYWSVYSTAWSENPFGITDRNSFSGKTVTLKIDDAGTLELLVDGVSKGKADKKFTAPWNILQIGSTGMDGYDSCETMGANLYNCTITGFRIYDGC